MISSTDPIKAGNLNLVGTNDSSSSSTGALIVAGGAGIGGNLNIAGGNYLTLGKNVAGNVVYPEDVVQVTTNANLVSRISKNGQKSNMYDHQTNDFELTKDSFKN
jgi:hypothetical protein